MVEKELALRSGDDSRGIGAKTSLVFGVLWPAPFTCIRRQAIWANLEMDQSMKIACYYCPEQSTKVRLICVKEGVKPKNAMVTHPRQRDKGMLRMKTCQIHGSAQCISLFSIWSIDWQLPLQRVACGSMPLQEWILTPRVCTTTTSQHIQTLNTTTIGTLKNSWLVASGCFFWLTKNGYWTVIS